MRTLLLGMVVFGLCASCSDGKTSASTKSGSGEEGGAGGDSDASAGYGADSDMSGGGAEGGVFGGHGASAGAPGASASGGMGAAGRDSVAAAGSSGDGTIGGDGGTGGSDPIPLPPGSREVDGLVNLVDEAAARALEEGILSTKRVPNFLRQTYKEPLNLFFDHYEEEYDFVFLFTDHVVDDATFAGQFEAINRPAEPGGGNDIDIAVGGYKTNGRTKGVIIVPLPAVIFPPLAHEVLHYWANQLDTRFGFGVGLNDDWGPHWGYAGVNGQLGGFDPATLRCETPAGAMPPNCTALTSGRVRYVVGAFGGYANGFRDAPYSPFELYLMGLIPQAQAPQTILMLTRAEVVSMATSAADPMVVEADGLTSVSLADIIARHGTITPLPAGARHFSAAFVVVSAEPAPSDVLAQVAEFAAVFGDRQSATVGSSFKTYTGGRATMNTLLGRRRDAATPPRPERDRFECDLIAQDCGDPNLACYMFPPNVCVLSDGVEEDEPCDASFACAPGLVCVSGPSAPNSYVCKPFCDPASSATAKACETLCPATYVPVTQQGTVVGAFCSPG